MDLRAVYQCLVTTRYRLHDFDLTSYEIDYVLSLPMFDQFRVENEPVQ